MEKGVRFGRGRLIGSLAAATLLLTACGPSSFRSHLPALPHIYLFQNTAPVQTPPSQLLLAKSAMPDGFQTLGAQAGDNSTLAKISTDPTQAAQRFAQWHRVDGALAAYARPSGQTGGLFFRNQTVQIDLGRYATTADAEGFFKAYGTEAPKIGQVSKLGDPGVTSANSFYQTFLPGVTVEQMYFQERNVVVRLMVIGPSDQSLIGMATSIAKAQRDRIDAAK